MFECTWFSKLRDLHRSLIVPVTDKARLPTVWAQFWSHAMEVHAGLIPDKVPLPLHELCLRCFRMEPGSYVGLRAAFSFSSPL